MNTAISHRQRQTDSSSSHQPRRLTRRVLTRGEREAARIEFLASTFRPFTSSDPLNFVFLGFAGEAKRVDYVKADENGNVDFESFTSEQNLKAAFDILKRNGGYAAGPDHVRLDEFNTRCVFAALRLARDLLRDGSYLPKLPRIYLADKSSGGKRPISIANVVDRCVAKALQLAFGDFWTHRLPRLRQDAWEIMAQIHHAALSGARSLAINDVRTCYDVVPVADALAVQNDYITDPHIRRLIEVLARNKTSTGIDRGVSQGCPYSPIVVEAFLSRHLDSHVGQNDNNVTYLRYADNIAFFGRNDRVSQTALTECASTLEALGMPFRSAGPQTQAMTRATRQSEYLGFALGLRPDGVELQIPRCKLTELQENLYKVSAGPNPETQCTWLIQGFMNYYACIPEESARQVISQIRRHTRQMGLYGIQWRLIERQVATGRSKWERLLNHHSPLGS